MAFKMYQERSSNRPIIQFVIAIIVLVFLAWFLVYSFGHSTENIGQSMEPTLQPEDTVLVDMFTYSFKMPERYDVIVFTKNDVDHETALHETGITNIKRIIGLPGETIQILNGNIYIDDVLLEDTRELGGVPLGGLATDRLTLDENEYFVLGDNRQASEDSRSVSIGNVQTSEIIGKCWLRIKPFSAFGRID